MALLIGNPVMNRNPPAMEYVRKWTEFSFIPNARRAIQKLTQSGYRIFVVTNQSGIGRGFYSEEDVRRYPLSNDC